MERDNEENGRGEREDTSTDGKDEARGGELWKATAILERLWQKRQRSNRVAGFEWTRVGSPSSFSDGLLRLYLTVRLSYA
jgi:hypothetical protein